MMKRTQVGLPDLSPNSRPQQLEDKYVPLGVKIRDEWLKRRITEMKQHYLNTHASAGQVQISEKVNDEEAESQRRPKVKVKTGCRKISKKQLPEVKMPKVEDFRSEIGDDLNNVSYKGVTDQSILFSNHLISGEKDIIRSNRKGKRKPHKKSHGRSLQELTPWNDNDENKTKRVEKANLKRRRVSLNKKGKTKRSSSGENARSERKSRSVMRGQSGDKLPSSSRITKHREFVSKQRVSRKNPKIKQKIVNKSLNDQTCSGRARSRSNPNSAVKLRVTFQDDLTESNIKDKKCKFKNTTYPSQQSPNNMTNKKNFKLIKSSTDDSAHQVSINGKSKPLTTKTSAQKDIYKSNSPVYGDKLKKQRSSSKMDKSPSKTKPSPGAEKKPTFISSKKIHKQVQTNFADVPDLQYKSDDLLTVVEVSRIQEQIMANRNCQVVRSPTSSRQGIARSSNASLSRQSRSSSKDASDHALGSLCSLDISSQGGVDTADAVSFHSNDLLEELKQKLSLTKHKGHLSASATGFKNHQSHPVTGIFSHNSLLKTCQQLGVHTIRKPSHLTHTLRRFNSVKTTRSKDSKKPSRKKRKKKRVKLLKKRRSPPGRRRGKIVNKRRSKRTVCGKSTKPRSKKRSRQMTSN